MRAGGAIILAPCPGIMPAADAGKGCGCWGTHVGEVMGDVPAIGLGSCCVRIVLMPVPVGGSWSGVRIWETKSSGNTIVTNLCTLQKCY